MQIVEQRFTATSIGPRLCQGTPYSLLSTPWLLLLRPLVPPVGTG
jgi:hypothetical protein